MNCRYHKRSNHNAKKTNVNSNCTKSKKREILDGWSVGPEYDSVAAIDIETWSRRKNKGEIANYLCSTDHFCEAILDREDFIESSLEKLEEVIDAGHVDIEEKHLKQDRTFKSRKVLINPAEKEILRTKFQEKSNKEKTLEKRTTISKTSLHGKSINTHFNDESSSLNKFKTNSFRPASSNSLPEKKLTSSKPRRHALSANDAYIDFPLEVLCSPDIVKLSYTNKKKSIRKSEESSSSNENEQEESSSYQNNNLYKFKLDNPQNGYILPNSANVSISDLLYTTPRIERHYSRDRDIAFAGLANVEDSKTFKKHIDINYTGHSLINLPTVSNKTAEKYENNIRFKTVASMPKIPLLPNRLSQSSESALILNHMVSSSGVIDEDNSKFPEYLYNSNNLRSDDVDVHYTPKDAAVETVVERSRWSSSLPKTKQHVIEPDVNNTVAWRQALESQIRYQRTTLSRRKKSQLRIGDRLYNLGIVQSAGRSQTRASVKR